MAIQAMRKGYGNGVGLRPYEVISDDDGTRLAEEALRLIMKGYGNGEGLWPYMGNLSW